MNSLLHLNALLEDIVFLEKTIELPRHDLCLDSRLLKKGDIFFALNGTALNGQDYIEDAIKKGAAAVLVDTAIAPEISFSMQDKVPVILIQNLRRQLGCIASRFYNAPEEALELIGITGTNGKTSCSHFIANALHKSGIPCGIIGTLGAGLYGNLTPTNNTTPDIFTLYKTLNELRDLGAKIVAMEVSSHALKQQRTQGLRFKIAIFTNLTQDHLDYHLTLEDYESSKKLLFDDYAVENAIINADDVVGQRWLTHLAIPNKYAYSLQNKIQFTPCISAQHCHTTQHGLKAVVKTPWGDGMLQSALLGNFNLSNLLATLTTLGIYNIPLSDALRLIHELHPVPGRMEKLGGGNQPLVIIDYSHTPDALEKALTTLRDYCKGELWCVFGCGGDRDKTKRPIMGEIAERYADNMIITDDNPRHENAHDIAQAILTGIQNKPAVIIEHNRRYAIAHAIACAQPEDVILIAGKGHETYQQIGNEKAAFSDAIEARLALENRIEKS